MDKANVMSVIRRVIEMSESLSLDDSEDRETLIASLDSAINSMADTSSPSPAVAAIEFALDDEDGMAFLRCWLHGDFDAVRKEWPEAPEAIYIGADPLYSEKQAVS